MKAEGKLCPNCGTLLPQAKLGEVVLRRNPDDCPLNFVSSLPRIQVLRSDLLAVLGDLSSTEVGSVYLSNGAVVNKFRFLIANEILARGGPESTIRGVCSGCGMVRYYPLPQPHKGGVRYLLRQSVTDQLPVYDLSVGGLGLREEVYERVAAKHFPWVKFYELRIRDEPEDGLPADLKPYLTSEEQVVIGDILWRDANKDRRKDRGGQLLPWKIERTILNPKPGGQDPPPEAQ